MTGELVAIPLIAASKRVDIYSGIQRLSGAIYGQLVVPTSGSARTVVVLTHPSSPFLDHYLLRPLADAGIAALGLNTRYAANDTNLIAEHVLLDLASTVATMRDRGYQRV